MCLTSMPGLRLLPLCVYQKEVFQWSSQGVCYKLTVQTARVNAATKGAHKTEHPYESYRAGKYRISEYVIGMHNCQIYNPYANMSLGIVYQNAHYLCAKAIESVTKGSGMRSGEASRCGTPVRSRVCDHRATARHRHAYADGILHAGLGLERIR